MSPYLQAKGRWSRGRPPTTAADRARARATIPRGSGPGDSGEPAVDADVWLTHVVYQHTRSDGVLADLVAEYRFFTWSVARRFDRGGEPIEDLRQVAMEALVVALQRFDCGRGIPFLGLAAPSISGSLKRHFRDRGWALRVPRQAHELAVAAVAATERLESTTGVTPSRGEVARALDISEISLGQVDQAVRARQVLSLDVPRWVDQDPVLDLAVEEERFTGADGRTDLRRALTTLSAEDQRLLAQYYFDELSQTEIAKGEGVSQMQVSRRIRAVLARLREHMQVVEPELAEREPVSIRS